MAVGVDGCGGVDDGSAGACDADAFMAGTAANGKAGAGLCSTVGGGGRAAGGRKGGMVALKGCSCPGCGGRGGGWPGGGPGATGRTMVTGGMTCGMGIGTIGAPNGT